MWAKKLFKYKRRSLIYGGILLALVAVLLSYLWLFRVEHEDNPALGKISYKYRWGKYFEDSIDSNRDGIADGRRIVRPGSKVGFTDTKCTEAWMSTRMDGRFDVHYWYENSSGIFHLEYDSDEDGSYDTFLQGQEAKDYLQSKATDI